MFSTGRSARQSALRRVIHSAQELDFDVMQGRLFKSAENGRWQIGSHDLVDWLEAHIGEEIVSLLGRADRVGRTSAEDPYQFDTQTCRKCGRDFIDTDCPHCRNNRRRIRGSG